MKVKFDWFENGNEVDLPDMKVEGSLAVANLTKQYVDDFVPFVNAIQEDATLRLRVTKLGEIVQSKEEASEDQLVTANAILRLCDIEPAEDKQEFFTQCKELYDKLSKEAIDMIPKVTRASVMAQPFFMERGLLEAYYMMKAYVWTKAKQTGTKPKMPFTLEELRSTIDDEELAIFSRHAIQKVTAITEGEAKPETPTPEEVKKKSTTTPA